MKCPNCGGKGKYKNSFGKVGICYYCLGTGKVNDKGEQVRTHEEWFCSLPTEEKADFLADLYPKSVGEALIKISNGDKESWEKWLKQPHREE